MKAKKQKPLGDIVFETLLTQISDGGLGPGSTINEKTLAEGLGVSRGPVREAIRRLQGIQLLSREPYLKARITSLAPQALLDLFEMREALEGMACRLASERISEEELARLGTELQAARDSGGRTGLNFDFHERIVTASRNERIKQALSGDMYHLLRLYRRRSGNQGRSEAAFTEHWQILRAMQSRDPDLAESLMRSHIARAARVIASQQDQEAARPPARPRPAQPPRLPAGAFARPKAAQPKGRPAKSDA